VALIDFAKQVQTLQNLAYKLTPCYNYIPDFSSPLQINRTLKILGNGCRLANNQHVAVPEISLLVYDEILKISSPVQGICGRYIDSTKLIYDAFTR
jgi:hypothetical protein